MKVSIVGVTGYSGIELLRLLTSHPFVTVHSIHSQQHEGVMLDHVLPHLKDIFKLPLEAVDPEKIMKETDMVVFSTPSGISKNLAIPFIEADFPIIDLSGDFRLRKAGVYEKWYGTSSAPLALIEKAQYGLAEFCKESKNTFVANPGCYATATLLGLAPLVQNNLIELDTIIVDGKSGLSGAGKGLTTRTHFPEVHDNMTVYKMNQHQHIPEILQQLQEWNPQVSTVQFSTSLIPVNRGIFTTIYVRPTVNLSDQDYLELYRRTYEDAPFVRISKEGQFPQLKQVVASNFCDIGLMFNEATRWLTIVSVLDNLVKGAAGQAIQNINRLGNFPSSAGLEFIPIWP